MSGKLRGLLNDLSRFGKNPMDTIADDIIIDWRDLDPKTRYLLAAAVIVLFKQSNYKAPREWAGLTRQLFRRLLIQRPYSRKSPAACTRRAGAGQ
jgi:hypothetical protein